MKKKIIQLSIKLDSDEQKRKLQILANKNTDGNISALIKMLADGKEIKK